jgi:hypothetical protein
MAIAMLRPWQGKPTPSRLLVDRTAEEVSQLIAKLLQCVSGD